MKIINFHSNVLEYVFWKQFLFTNLADALNFTIYLLLKNFKALKRYRKFVKNHHIFPRLPPHKQLSHTGSCLRGQNRQSTLNQYFDSHCDRCARCPH